jgi:hypothetical protein
MYFADDPNSGITAYALDTLPEDTCLGIYSGGENTSPMMVKAPHYGSTYSWDDGGDIKKATLPKYSLDARFPGSGAMRLLNDYLDTAEEKTTVILMWDPITMRLEGRKTKHTAEVVRNQKLTTRYGPAFWCSPVHPPEIIRKARDAYSGRSARKFDECTPQQWSEAISDAIKRGEGEGWSW